MVLIHHNINTNRAAAVNANPTIENASEFTPICVLDIILPLGALISISNGKFPNAFADIGIEIVEVG